MNRAAHFVPVAKSRSTTAAEQSQQAETPTRTVTSRHVTPAAVDTAALVVTTGAPSKPGLSRAQVTKHQRPLPSLIGTSVVVNLASNSAIAPALTVREDDA
jgi:hypothetical protein